MYGTFIYWHTEYDLVYPNSTNCVTSLSALVLKKRCKHFHIFTSTKYDSLYFLRKLIVIHSSLESDRTETYIIQ